MILIGIMFVLAGIFKWYIVLSIFTWRIKPDTKRDVWLIRIVSIIIGIPLYKKDDVVYCCEIIYDNYNRDQKY